MTQRARRYRRLFAAVALPVLASVAVGTPARGEGGPTWLETINQFRASAGLPAVIENPAWTPAVAAHARYVALTRLAYHDEDRSSPYYSADGAAAAKRSLIAGWWGAQRSEPELVKMWIAAPFHLLHLLEPGLHQVAMGVFQESSPAASAGVVDVFQGLDSKVKLATPIVFPGAGATMPMTTFDGETPNPLRACPGYAAPAGLPIVAMLPTPPSDVRTELSSNGQPVEHCTITAAGYASPDANEQALVRALLKQKNAVVLIPRSPLTVGATYTATVTNGGQPVTWSFATAGPDRAPTAVSPLPVPTASPDGVTASPVVKVAAAPIAVKVATATKAAPAAKIAVLQPAASRATRKTGRAVTTRLARRVPAATTVPRKP